MEEATPKIVAAYLPFKTFLSALESLDHGLPKKLDRTMWRSQSGIVQGQIMMALRFLKLVDDQDEPTLELLGLTAPENKPNRSPLLGAIAQKAYKDIFVHDLTKMTPKMLEDAMGKYGVQGDTKRKAVAFFLRMAKYAELPMHPLLAAQTRNSATGPRKRRKKNGDDEIDESLPVPVSDDSQTKVVALRSGTTLNLTVTANWIDMSTIERSYVFGVIDRLHDIPAGLQAPKGEAK